MGNASRQSKLHAKRRRTSGQGQRQDRGYQPRDDEQGQYTEPASA